MGKQNQSNPTAATKAQEVAEFGAGVSKGDGLGVLCVLTRDPVRLFSGEAQVWGAGPAETEPPRESLAAA